MKKALSIEENTPDWKKTTHHCWQNTDNDEKQKAESKKHKLKSYHTKEIKAQKLTKQYKSGKEIYNILR